MILQVLVLAWARSVCPRVTNLSLDWADGRVLASLVLAARPDLLGLAAALESGRDAAEVARTVVSVIAAKLAVAPLLPLPECPDKRVTLLYLLRLAAVLRPTITSEMLAGILLSFTCKLDRDGIEVVNFVYFIFQLLILMETPSSPPPPHLL